MSQIDDKMKVFFKFRTLRFLETSAIQAWLQPGPLLLASAGLSAGRRVADARAVLITADGVTTARRSDEGEFEV